MRCKPPVLLFPRVRAGVLACILALSAACAVPSMQEAVCARAKLVCIGPQQGFTHVAELVCATD